MFHSFSPPYLSALSIVMDSHLLDFIKRESTSLYVQNYILYQQNKIIGNFTGLFIYSEK